jgi:hypothetical protein
MRVFHVKHSGECAPAPPARPAPPRCLERPGGPVPNSAPPVGCPAPSFARPVGDASRPAGPAPPRRRGAPLVSSAPPRRRVSPCRTSCVVRRAPPHCSLLASAVPNPSVRSRRALRLTPRSFLCAVADVRARARALATCSCCDRLFGGRLHLAPYLASARARSVPRRRRPALLRQRRVSCPVRVHLVLAPHRAPSEPIFSRSHVSPCALLRAPPELASSRGCASAPPGPRAPPASPRAPWRPCPEPAFLLRPPPLPGSPRYDVSRETLVCFCSRLHLRLRFCSPPSPPVLRLCRSSLSPLGRSSVCLPAPSSCAPLAYFPSPCPTLSRAPPRLAPSRSRPLSVLPHTFLMITRGLLNLLPRYSVG